MIKRLSCSISQESYIIWSSLVIHKCKRMIFPGGFFFHFFKVLIFQVVRGVKGQKLIKNYKIKHGSDASGHAPLCLEIITYIFYKWTIFCDKQLSLYSFHGEEINGNTATFIYESLYVLQNVKTVSVNILRCLNFYCC